MILLGVAGAGALGAFTRYLVDGAVAARVGRVFPWGTLVVNVTGTLILGFLTGLVLYHGLRGAPVTLIGVGFCGAYTTFSTFTLETIRLLEEGASVEAALAVLASLAAGLGVAVVGLALAAVV